MTHDLPLLRAATVAATLLAVAGCTTPPPTQSAAWKVEAVFNVSNASGISEAHYAIGRRHDRAQAWAMAVESYRKAVSVDPRNVEAHNALGVALSRAGQHDDAVASLRSAVALDPGRAHLHSNLGNALLRAGRSQEAIGELKQALVLNTRDAIARANLQLAVAQNDSTGLARDNSGADSSAPQTQAVTDSMPVAPSAKVAANRFTTVVTVHPKAPASTVTSAAVSMPLTMQVFDAPSVPSLEVPVTHTFESLTVLAGQGSPRPPPTSVPLPATARELSAPTFAVAGPPRIEIANGNGVTGMAARLGAFLRANGLVDRALLSNVPPFDVSTTVVHYRAGFRDAAQQIVTRAPYRMELAAEAGGAFNADIRVVLGRDVRAVGRALAPVRTLAADEATGPKAIERFVIRLRRELQQESRQLLALAASAAAEALTNLARS